MHILYIDDEPHSRRLVRKMLAGAGHTMVEADNVLAGLQVAMRERPHAILIDFNLPFVDGAQGAHLLRMARRFDGVPVIGVSADFDAMQAASRQNEPAYTDFIAKPVDRAVLLGVLDQCVRTPRSG